MKTLPTCEYCNCETRWPDGAGSTVCDCGRTVEPQHSRGSWSWEFCPQTHKPIALASNEGDVLLFTDDGERAWIEPASNADMALIQLAPAFYKVLRGILNWQQHSCEKCEAGCPYAHAHALLEGLASASAPVPGNAAQEADVATIFPSRPVREVDEDACNRSFDAALGVG